MELRISNTPELHPNPVDCGIMGGHPEDAKLPTSKSGAPEATVLVGGTPVLPDQPALGNQTRKEGETGPEKTGVTGTQVKTTEDVSNRAHRPNPDRMVSARPRRADLAHALTLIGR